MDQIPIGSAGAERDTRCTQRLASGVGSFVVALWLVTAGEARESPTHTVRTTVNQVIRILDDPTMKQSARLSQRRQLLEDVIGARFNYEEMSKRTLTTQWKLLKPQERAEFVKLFRSFLSDRYADKIEGYAGEDIQYLSERIDGLYAEVRTRIVSDKLEIPMDYRLLEVSGEWLVYDMIIDGVSLVRNYRGQFDKVIRDASYAELLRRLRARAGDLSDGKDG